MKPVSSYRIGEDSVVRRSVQRYRGPRESEKFIALADQMAMSIGEMAGDAVTNLNNNLEDTLQEIDSRLQQAVILIGHLRSQRRML